MINRPRLRYELFAHPLFIGVLLLKLAASAFFASKVMADWFAPFVAYFVSSHFANPWQHFYEAGILKAFPYPPGMLYVMALPNLLAGDMPLGPLRLLLMRLPLLAGDLAIYSVLGIWFRDRLKVVRLWYWCSPIVFYVCYVHGQLDMVPTALFMVSLYFLERRMPLRGLLIYGLALSTKNHLLIALPFLMVYLYGRVSLGTLGKGLALAVATWAALVLPWYSDPAFQAMVLKAEEQSWVFKYALPVGMWDTVFLLCPAALLLIFAKYASYARHNWDLTMLFIGVAFCSFVVLVPPMPGWYLWSLPFIIYYACRFQSSSAVLLAALSLAYVAYFVFGSRSDFAFAAPPGALANSLYFTILQGAMLATVLSMYSRGIRSNEVYGPRSRPTLIGIAGDSGAGKDHLASLLARLLGERDAIRLAGDDYHRWERGDKNWRTLTHLDPKGNRLHEQLEHTLALRQGSAIAKADYDHGSGRFTELRLVDPRKNVIVQGLHSFVLEEQRKLFDLKVFLDPDEKLRLFWKTRRDRAQRQASKAGIKDALKRRQKDRLASVLPQRSHADLVFSLQPQSPAELKDLGAQPSLALMVEGRNSYDFESLSARLGRIPGLQARLEYPKGLSRIRLHLKGGAASEEIDRAALELIPNLADLAGTGPAFAGGMDGIMSLIMLFCLSSALRWKEPGSQPLP